MSPPVHDDLDLLMRDLVAGTDPAGTCARLAAYGEAAVRAVLDPTPYGPVPAGRDPRDLSGDLSMALQFVAARDAGPVVEALRRGEGSFDALLYALGSSRDAAAVDALLAAAKHRRGGTRGVALHRLGSTGDPRALPALLEALGDRDMGVRVSALSALAHFHHPPSMRPVVQRFLARSGLGPGEEMLAVRILGTLDGPAGFDAIAQATCRHLAPRDAGLPEGLAARARALADRLGALGESRPVWWSRQQPPDPLLVRGTGKLLGAPLDPGHFAMMLEVGAVRIPPWGESPGITFVGVVESGAPWTSILLRQGPRVAAGSARVPLAFADDAPETIGYGPDNAPCRWLPDGAPEPVDATDPLGWMEGSVAKLG